MKGFRGAFEETAEVTAAKERYIDQLRIEVKKERLPSPRELYETLKPYRDLERNALTKAANILLHEPGITPKQEDYLNLIRGLLNLRGAVMNKDGCDEEETRNKLRVLYGGLGPNKLWDYYIEFFTLWCGATSNDRAKTASEAIADEFHYNFLTFLDEHWGEITQDIVDQAEDMATKLRDDYKSRALYYKGQMAPSDNLEYQQIIFCSNVPEYIRMIHDNKLTDFYMCIKEDWKYYSNAVAEGDDMSFVANDWRALYENLLTAYRTPAAYERTVRRKMTVEPWTV